MLYIFAGFCKVYTDYYLNRVDGDTILSCEVFRVAQETLSLLSDIIIPQANGFFGNITFDANKNIHAEFDINGEKQKILLNYTFTARR